MSEHQDSSSSIISFQVSLVNKYGIHVRTAAILSELCESFQSQITITSPHATSDGNDMMRLLLLQAGHGTILKIQVQGDDASLARDALIDLFSDGFGFEDERLTE